MALLRQCGRGLSGRHRGAGRLPAGRVRGGWPAGGWTANRAGRARL